MKAIDPTEILVDGEGTIKDVPIRANPWLRFLGRMCDYSLFCILIYGVRTQLPFGAFESIIPFEYFVWIPIEAALLHFFGTTPGKWLLGTVIRQGRRVKLDFPTALKRSFNVWFRGMGLGIPFIMPFSLFIAYNRLKLLRFTTWDAEDHIQVTHRPVGRWRIALAIVIVIFGLSFYFSSKHMEIKTVSYNARVI